MNPGSAVSCDCGYSFVPGVAGKPLRLAEPAHARLSRNEAFVAQYAVRTAIGIAIAVLAVLLRRVLFT